MCAISINSYNWDWSESEGKRPKPTPLPHMRLWSMFYTFLIFVRNYHFIIVNNENVLFCFLVKSGILYVSETDFSIQNNTATGSFGLLSSQSSRPSNSTFSSQPIIRLFDIMKKNVARFAIYVTQFVWRVRLPPIQGAGILNLMWKPFWCLALQEETNLFFYKKMDVVLLCKVNKIHIPQVKMKYCIIIKQKLTDVYIPVIKKLEPLFDIQVWTPDKFANFSKTINFPEIWKILSKQNFNPNTYVLKAN